MTSRTVLALILVATAVSCATPAPRVKKTEKVDLDSAYLYGNYAMLGPANASIGLELRSIDEGSSYLIKFQKREKNWLVVTKVRPGTYRLTKFVALSVGNQIIGSKDLKGFPFGTPFTLSAGSVYYLGDYNGEYWTEPLQMKWRLAGFRYDRPAAEGLLRKLYPEFSDIPSLDAFVTPTRQWDEISEDSPI